LQEQVFTAVDLAKGLFSKKSAQNSSMNKNLKGLDSRTFVTVKMPKRVKRSFTKFQLTIRLHSRRPNAKERARRSRKNTPCMMKRRRVMMKMSLKT